MTTRSNGVHTRRLVFSFKSTPAITGAKWRPREDSNLGSRLRRAVLYPLSYGGIQPTAETSEDISKRWASEVR